jgi:nucleoside-diphosphate-sugar epimerase
MRVLVIGGTGLISTGIVKHLLERGAEVTLFHRGKRPGLSQLETVLGDRDDAEGFARAMAGRRFDVVIDMICYRPAQAAAAIQAFAGKCEQFIFCSTAATYGIKSPPGILIDETFSQEPISDYGKAKVACEQELLRAHAAGHFKATIFRPSHTYGPGHPLLDNLEFDAVAWDRISRDQPVLCAGDGLGLWVSTHRDDCGKLFAHAALNPKTYGQAYNATRSQHLSWRDYYREVAESMGRTARLLFMPAQWIAGHDPQRFSFLREISAFHGAYDSFKAVRDVPGFRCEIGLGEGARQVFEDQRRRNAWKDSAADTKYSAMVQAAMSFGISPVEA